MGILGRGLVVDHVSVGSSHIIDLVIFAPGHHLFCCSLGGLMKGTKEKEVWRFHFIKTLQFLACSIQLIPSLFSFLGRPM